MKRFLLYCSIFFFTIACNSNSKNDVSQINESIVGTWKLTSGSLTEKGNTTVTDYTKNISFIKIINESHFAFLQHDLNKGKDSAASFVAGGGSYTLKDSTYIENLEYCSARDWEGHQFTFTLELKGDSLIQKGREKIDSLGVDRLNVERYVRVKNSSK